MAVAHRDVHGLLRKHNYSEIRKIGEGSFGKAILVQDVEANKLVCKMVDVSQASARETQDAVKEGKLLAALKHPYIVRYREYFIDSGWFCILMDFCEGGDLTKQIEQAKRRKQPLSEDQILRWFTQAMLALKYIHDKHVLHRDLKPGNFFLSKSGNLKMGDFGIAKVLSCTLACARTQIGTPYYLSPEVCQEKPYTWPSDIWAMGCILYEMCALKVPFDAANISGLVQKICRGPTPEVPGYSDFTKELCKEMLSRTATQRPSAEDILHRARIQGIVKMMLDEAQAAQQDPAKGSSHGSEKGSESADAPVNAPRLPLVAPAAQGGYAPQPVPAGPYGDSAGTYRKNSLVEYHSSTHKDWLPASVVNVDNEGSIIIDLKPNTWISKEEQAHKVRRRRPEGVPAPIACATPLRQRSPSVDRMSRPGGASPGRWRSREASPNHDWMNGLRAEGENRSRAGTPGRSRANTPSRCASPRGAPYQQAPQPQALPSAAVQGVQQVRPPGMPRVPGSPGPVRRASPAVAAGMAIAGV
mmetsp:Transcript_19333/g.35014  ORF Transcript_19333/g.35014 Transcript_19333/m.35014 type:complete len:528 (-) Transcript_19333:193-1776(-)